MDLQGELGYSLKASKEAVCTQCHEAENDEGFASIHQEHVTEERIECSSYHNFSRPELNLEADHNQ